MKSKSNGKRKLGLEKAKKNSFIWKRAAPSLVKFKNRAQRNPFENIKVTQFDSYVMFY